ncbi:MAG: hypothetical protein WAZ14_01530 [Patescibacteria group bacterium]
MENESDEWAHLSNEIKDKIALNVGRLIIQALQKGGGAVLDAVALGFDDGSLKLAEIVKILVTDISITNFTVELQPGIPWQVRLSELKLQGIGRLVTETDFPLTLVPKATVRQLKLVSLGRQIDEDDVEACLRDMGLRSASTSELLAHAAQYSFQVRMRMLGALARNQTHRRNLVLVTEPGEHGEPCRRYLYGEESPFSQRVRLPAGTNILAALLEE